MDDWKGFCGESFRMLGSMFGGLFCKLYRVLFFFRVEVVVGFNWG